jgi:hypothetical protein
MASLGCQSVSPLTEPEACLASTSAGAPATQPSTACLATTSAIAAATLLSVCTCKPTAPCRIVQAIAAVKIVHGHTRSQAACASSALCSKLICPKQLLSAAATLSCSIALETAKSGNAWCYSSKCIVLHVLGCQHHLMVMLDPQWCRQRQAHRVCIKAMQPVVVR